MKILGAPAGEWGGAQRNVKSLIDGLMGNTKIEKGLGNTNSEVCSTVKWKRNLHWGKSLLAGRKGRPMQGELNQLVGYFDNMVAHGWLAHARG